jgi:hypothetical protein
MTSLSPGITYYVKAYASNSLGTGYGQVESFTTSNSGTLASVTTDNLTSLSEFSVTVNGNVSSDGGSTVTGRGVCYSTNQLPTISNSFVSSGSGTGSFSANISGLNCGTTYYVRAYATNASGTSYGNQFSFVPSQQSTVATPYLLTNVSTTNCGSYNFTSSFSLACQALSEYNNNGCGSNRSLTGGDEYRTNSFTVGGKIYPWNTPWCVVNLTGYFIMNTTKEIVYINNGVIQSITSCP